MYTDCPTISYKRGGLLTTPEGCLALACLRRLIDPSDTLASAEIHCLTTCENPETWIAERIHYRENTDHPLYQWLEQDGSHPVAALAQQRSRLPYLTPLEILHLAIQAGDVRKTVFRWGPDRQRARHRLNNLSALLQHARDYMDQCEATKRRLYERGRNSLATTVTPTIVCHRILVVLRIS